MCNKKRKKDTELLNLIFLLVSLPLKHKKKKTQFQNKSQEFVRKSKKVVKKKKHYECRTFIKSNREKVTVKKSWLVLKVVIKELWERSLMRMNGNT